MLKPKRLIAIGLSLLAILSVLPVYGTVFKSDVRALLSIGKVKELDFTPVGEYILQEEPKLSIGTDELTVKAVGGHVSLTVGGKTVTGPSLTLKSKNYGKTTDYIRLKNDEYGTCTYLGNMTFDVQEGRLRAINTLPVEQYLYGVVPHEMSNSFPKEALKAQAVCARSYVVSYCSKYSGRSYDIRDTSSDQVYRGYASKNTRAIAAVDETAGQVITYEGDIIEAYYSASNGGQTERTGNVWEKDFPYYVNADDPYDLKNLSSLEESSFIPEVYDDTTTGFMDIPVLYALRKGAMEAAGQDVELVSTVAVIPTEPSYDSPSRCYTKANVVLNIRTKGEDGQTMEGQVTVVLPLEDLSFGSIGNSFGKLNPKKTRLRMFGAERGSYSYLDSEYPGWYITNRRYGHGIGLSQRSAQERARAGQSYEDITSFYYVNTSLSTVGSFDSAPKLDGGKYKIKSWGVSKIKPGTTANELLDELSSDGKLTIIDRKGGITDGKLCTGDFVRTTYGESSLFDLPIVIFGDANGDSKIDKEDISALQAHISRLQPLSGPYLKAADVDHDGSVNMFDLLHLIQYTQDDAKISQED